MRGENKYFNQTAVIVFAFFQFVDKQVWMGGGRREIGGGRWEKGVAGGFSSRPGQRAGKWEVFGLWSLVFG